MIKLDSLFNFSLLFSRSFHGSLISHFLFWICFDLESIKGFSDTRKKMMEKQYIASLDRNISRIGLGTWAMGGWMWGGSDEKKAIATLVKAFEMGIHLVDTAPVYGFGAAEEMIGKALRKYKKRDDIFIVTKCGLSWKDRKVFRDARKDTVIKEAEDSLKRMQIDSIDLYQVHWPDAKTPFAETAEALRSLLKEGKVRAIGVCNFSMEQMEEYMKHLPIQALQAPFNLFESQIEMQELSFCKIKKIPVIGYGSLCRGLLTGKIQKNTEYKGDDLRKDDPKFQEPKLSQYLRCVSQLQDWVQLKYRKPLAALAVRWVLDKGVNVALWGARQPEQLRSVPQVEGWKLTSQDFQEIDQIIKKTITDPASDDFMGPAERE
jgi:aryl-alcohol dehydrogenase-like predicted oxidoreductase